MANSSHLVPVEPGHAADDEIEIERVDWFSEDGGVEPDDWDDVEEINPVMRRGWLAPFFAIIVMLAWSGFFGWANRSQILSGASPSQWIDWIVSWSVPIVLVLAIWFLVMRNSRAEAARYTDAANALSYEAAQLETQLIATNRELSLAREFISAQGRDLEHLGRTAADRLSEHATRIEDLIGENSRNVDRIADVSVTALENMERLRSDLPVIANSARDVANQIGHAGEGAHAHLEGLIAGFGRLNDFGTASERQVDALQQRIGSVLKALHAQVDQLHAVANDRFDALRERSEQFRAELDTNEVEALAGVQRRADSLLVDLDVLKERLGNDEDKAIHTMDRRLSTLRDGAASAADRLRETEDAAIARLDFNFEGLRERLGETIGEVERIDREALAAANMRLGELHREAEQVDAALTRRNEVFENDMAARKERMVADADDASGQLIARLTDLDDALGNSQAGHIERLETLTGQSDTLHSRIEELDARLAVLRRDDDAVAAKLGRSSDDLIGKLENSRALLDTTGGEVAEITDASIRLLELIQAGSEHSKVALPAAMSAAEERLRGLREEGNALAGQMSGIAEKGAEVSEHILAAHDSTQSTHEQLVQIEQRLQRNVAQGEEARNRMTAALEELDAAVHASVKTMHDDGAVAISSYAERIGENSAAAIGRAMDENGASAIAALDVAAANASNRSRDAAIQLRDQLAMVNELTANLERRVADARERAEDEIGNDFARRVALITESLNSNAIDLSKALSNEVSDTAWAAYLKGDRGIFTRRAVRLLESQETRAVADIYEEDADFREHVSRYIHDFEAMLRTLLSTRDGNALSVTMLSSDMGKLYVALAQAINRLRD